MRINKLGRFLYPLFVVLVAISCNTIRGGSRPPAETELPDVSVPAIAPTSTPIPAPLIGREPYEWMPPYDAFTTFGSLPFERYIDSSNQDVSKTRDNPAEMLNFLNDVGRIHGYGYRWNADNCWLANDVFLISEGTVSVVWFRTAEGARKALEFYEQEDRADPGKSVEDVEYGDGAYILTNTYDDEDCSETVRYRQLMWVRYNLIGSVRMGSHGRLNDEELYRYMVEVRDVLDQTMENEAKAFPNAVVQEVPSQEAGPDDPLSFLSGQLDCAPSGGDYSVYGFLLNNGTRAIDLEVTMTIYKDDGFFDQITDTSSLPAGVETLIAFSGGYIPDPYLSAPPDNPDTPEYEPEVWIESMGGLPEYSCDIVSTARWGD